MRRITNGNDNNSCSHIWSEIKYDSDIVTITPYPLIGGMIRASHFAIVERWSKDCVKHDKKVYLFKSIDFFDNKIIKQNVDKIIRRWSYASIIC